MLAGISSFIFGSEDIGGTAPSATTIIDDDKSVPSQTPVPRSKTYRSRRRRPASMSSPLTTKRGRFGTSIEELHGEQEREQKNSRRSISPDTNPIVISDNEDQTPTRATKKIASSIARSSDNPLRQDRSTKSRDSTKAEFNNDEAWLMGGLTRHAPDESPVPDPMARGLNMKPKTGGYRPVDTLSGPANQTSRSSYQTQTTRRSPVDKPSTGIRENNHVEPHKRRRTQSSPVQPSHPARVIPLDQSHDMHDTPTINLYDSPTSKRVVGNMDPSYKVQSVAEPQERLFHPHGGQLFQDLYKSIPPAYQKGKGSGHGTYVDFARIDKNKVAKTNSVERDRAYTQGMAKHLTSLLSSSPTTSEDPSKVAVPQNPSLRRNEQIEVEDTIVDDRHVAKVKHGYGLESPDALQEEDNPRKRNGHPSKRTNVEDLIMGDSKSTKIVRRASRSNGKHAKISTFGLRNVYYPDLVQSQLDYVFEVNHDTGTFAINTRETAFSESVTTPIGLARVTKVVYSEPDGDLFGIQLSKASGVPQYIMLQLQSHKSVLALGQVLCELDERLKVLIRKDDHMKRMFANMNQTQPHQAIEIDPQMPGLKAATKTSSGLTSEYFRVAEAGRRTTPADRLKEPQDVHELPSRSKRTEQRASNQYQSNAQLQSNGDIDGSKTVNLEHKSDIGTRSQPPKMSTSVLSNKPKTKYSETGALGKPWKKPLMYPKEAKKREAVDFDDLARLDEDEFLNDELINFFQRYLQHQVEQTKPEMLRKMHFFGTHFYSALIKNTKSRREINYGSVEKWTKAIDIFKRDFVIVPVNENLHWFLAIICNLSFFDKQQNYEELEDSDTNGPVQDLDRPGGEEAAHDINGQAPETENDNTHQTQQSFQELSLQDDHTKDVFDIPRSSDTERTPSGSRGRKKKVRQLPKYESHLPIIITFDSLGQARTPAITALRQYIIQEGKAKRNMDIDGKDIKGMTAKGIPNQSNFSDCGLYECMYLEQFMVDPYGFVNRQLQREESNYGWPKSIYSDELRSRYRNMILEIYHEQNGMPSEHPIPEVGKILTDIKPHLPESRPDAMPHVGKWMSKEEIRARKAQFNQIRQENTSSSARTMPPTSSASEQEIGSDETIVEMGGAPAPANGVDVINVDQEPRHSTRLSRKSINQHNSPKELADNLRHNRSPTKLTKQDDEEQRDRHQRSDSVSTDHLSGLNSYLTTYPARDRYKPKSTMPGSFDTGGDKAREHDDDNINDEESQDLSLATRIEIAESQQTEDRYPRRQRGDANDANDDNGNGHDGEEEEMLLRH